MTEILPKDLWKAIVLYGLNQASYKMALGKVLLQFSKQERYKIRWDELSQAFLDEYVNRLQGNSKPQQATLGRMTKMERIVGSLKNGSVSYEDAIGLVAKEGFSDVVPRFQTIGNNTNLVGKTFYEFDFGKSLSITDNLLGIAADDSDSLIGELEARWGLLEGAFSINQSAEKLVLANDIRETFLRYGDIKRANLTDNIPFLSGYQGNTCFYCGEAIKGTPHVDHVLPRQVVMHDHIWNLVLSHPNCNLQKSDKLIGEHFLQKLIFRNENIMGSNHPWKKKISNELGNSKNRRESKTRDLYSKVKIARGEVYWGSGRAFDPRHDDFYKKFVTILNNGSWHE